MQAQNQEIDHQRVREELKELSPVELGALMLSMQKGVESKYGQRIDPADLPALPKYQTTEALLEDVEQRRSKGEPYARMFELTGKGAQDQYVRNALSELEYALARGSGQKLSYMWFRDDHGNAQVFLIEERKGTDAMSMKPSATEITSGCVEFGSIPDKNLNRQERLPANTPAEEAIMIHRKREEDAKLVFQDFDPFTTTPVDLDRQVSAIKLGLNRYATDEDIKRARAEINNSIDDSYNYAENYPQGTTFSARLKLFQERRKLSDLIGENIDPTKDKEEIANIRDARSQRLSELTQLYLYVGNSAQSMLQSQMNAVRIGLPEDTNPFVVEETRERLSRQSLAVLRGLNKDAIQQEIDAAERKSSDYETLEIPANVCPAQDPTAQTVRRQ